MEERKPKFIVVIGTSSGGFFALAELINQLNEEMDAAFFVVMHLSHEAIGSYLVNQMQKFSTLFCTEVKEEAVIKKSTIYFAPPNKHLIIKNGKVEPGSGPQENRGRPSIDVLFRSAAAAYDGRTIGIILTGMPDDGTAGMSAIKRCGGTCVVQDPDEAEYPDMPLSVLKEVDVDYCIPLSQMGMVILDIIANKEIQNTIIPTDIIKEIQMAEDGIGTINEMEEIGKNSVFSCPDCGGVLFELNNDAIIRFKCHTGHCYSVNDLLLKQNKNLESSLWIALRSLEERKKLLSQLSEKNIQRGYHQSGSDYPEKISELQKHVDNLKGVLFATQKEKENF
jgi:two-component system, chemotaxis family, protein-glutamate methylesterase/glutaminase